MKAFIIGSTGATGKDLVKVLLQDPDYTEVVAFVRGRSGLTHPKLVEVVTNFEKLDEVAQFIRGDVWFSCLGTTAKAAGSQEAQWRIDHDIPARFAEMARRNGVSKAVLVSAYGASATSKVFYTRMKGMLDEHVTGLEFDSCLIFRPGWLLRKDSNRWMERLMGRALMLLNGLGLLRKFRPLPTAVLAEKMVKAAKVRGAGTRIVELDEVWGV